MFLPGNPKVKQEDIWKDENTSMQTILLSGIGRVLDMILMINFTESKPKL